jgi:DnaJ-class molecular chaperone
LLALSRFFSDLADHRRSKGEKRMSDNQIIHEGVTYSLITNLPPLKSHVVKCPCCDGSGQMYGRNCRECKGKGRLFPPLSDERDGRAGR